MPVAAVYDGAARGSGGTLFEGKKFWIAQRVPARATWKQSIEVLPTTPVRYLGMS